MKTRKNGNVTKKTRRTVIPLHIYQVWHDKDMPSSVKESVDMLKEQNPEFEHHLYDEAMCRTYLKNNFPKRVVQAFDKVIPYALKADIWRYCILYKKGGVYLDSKYYGMNGFKLLQLTDKEYFCGVKHDNNSGIYNAFMICKPGNKKLLHSIQQFVKNTEENYYGHKALCVGPLMMESFFTKKDFELEYEFITFQKQYIEFHGERILQRHKYYHEQKKNRWMDAWKDRTLYHYQRRIPSILFQTSKDPPLAYAVKQLKEHAIGWDYMHFTDKDILQFFKDYPLKEFPRIEEVFHSFEKGEHKADLFRYYFLYVKGGVFIDSDAMLQVDLNSIACDYEFFSVESKYINPKSIFQGLIGSTPKNKIVYEALKDMYTITKETMKDYFIIVKHLYPIVQKYKKDYHLKLYVEKWHVKPSKKTKCESVILEDGTETPLLMHYPCAGKVPK